MSNNNIAELIDNLLYYNAWRRGEHDDMPAPKDVGMWLDAACDELGRLQSELDRHPRSSEKDEKSIADKAHKTVAGFGGLASPWRACLLPV